MVDDFVFWCIDGEFMGLWGDMNVKFVGFEMFIIFGY